MGFFSRFTRPRWQKLEERAQKAHKNGHPAQAFEACTEALGCSELDDDGRQRLMQLESTCRTELAALNIRLAEQHLGANQFGVAEEHVVLAQQFAATEEEKAQVEKLVQILERHEQGDKTMSVTEGVAVTGEVVDAHALELHTASYPERIGDGYAEMPSEWQAAVLNLHAGDAKGAIDVLRAHSGSHPATWSFLELGRGLLALGEFEEALDAFAKAIESDPKWKNPYLASVVTWWEKGDLEAAEEPLQAAVDRFPRDLDVLLAVAEAAERAGTPDFGIEAMELAIDIDESDLRCRRAYAQLLEADGKSDQAIEAYEYVVGRTWRMRPDSGQVVLDGAAAHRLAMLLYRKQTGLERASELLGAVLSSIDDQTRPWIELDLALICEAAGDDERAERLRKGASEALAGTSRAAQNRLKWLKGDREGTERKAAKVGDTMFAAFTAQRTVE